MNCERTVEELSAYLDGELPEDMARLVGGHLEGCPSCAAELRSLQSADKMVAANVPEIEPRPEVWHNVHARLATRPSTAQRESWLRLLLGWRRLALATAVVVALTAGVWGYLRYQSSQEELNQYMSRYIHERDMQEQMDRSRLGPALLDGTYVEEEQLEPARNPFSVVNFSPEENPFRAEDR